MWMTAGSLPRVLGFEQKINTLMLAVRWAVSGRPPPGSSPLPPAPSSAWNSRNLLSCRKDPVLGDQPSGPLVHLFCVTLDKTLGLSGVDFLKYIVG